tara:strand:+ start:259 stop:666 length:408 start_codon:yes stop_codon:yes gene_type:complete
MNEHLFTSGHTKTGSNTSTPSPGNEQIVNTLTQQLNLKTEMGKERLRVAIQAVKLFDRKQHDYGSRNIAFSDSAQLNAIGVAIRLNDKIQRMLNLSRKQLEGQGAEVKDESLEDTAIDICNYGAILTMLLTNRWR